MLQHGLALLVIVDGIVWAGYSGWHCMLRTATAAGSNISHKQWHCSELGRHGTCVGPYLLWCSESKFGWSAPFQWIVEYPCTFSDYYWMVLYSKAVVIDLYAGKFLCILTPKAAAPAEVIHSEFLHHWLWLKRYQDFVWTNLPGLYVVHKHSLRGNRLKARLLLCMCIFTSFSCDNQHFLWWMLQVDPPECKILLTDPPLNPTRNREKTVCLLVLWFTSLAGFVVLLCSLWEKSFISVHNYGMEVLMCVQN